MASPMSIVATGRAGRTYRPIWTSRLAMPLCRRSAANDGNERQMMRKTTIRQAILTLVLAGAILGQGLPVLAETTLDVPAPDALPDLAPDAVAVTDPTAIRQALEELTIFGRYVDNGEQWIEYHLKDGRTAYSEKGCTYPGKWWIEEGNVCYAYPNYRDNAPNCFLMFMRPNGAIQFFAFDAGGSPYLASASEKTEHGNVAHLPVGGLSPCVGV